MSTPVNTISGLARIVSSEPMPLAPVFRTKDATRIAAEIEKYCRDLNIWLTRLAGKFTATNIVSTINQGSTGIGFDKVIHKSYHYSGTDQVTVTLDNTIDWRRLGIIYRIVGGSSVSLVTPGNVQSNVYAQAGTGVTYPLTVLGTSYNLCVLQLVVASSGNLQAVFNTSGTHKEAYIDISVSGFGAQEVLSANFSSLGNGS